MRFSLSKVKKYFQLFFLTKIFRMCILNKGSVAYFGSQQNLKNQYSKHLHVVIEIKEENRNALLFGLKKIDPEMSYSTAGSNMIR